MNLLVLSHKELWRDSNSPSGYSTIGGFPFQMKALAELFDETVIMATEHSTPLPAGAIPLTGNHLRVETLPAPVGRDLRRKLDMLLWLPCNLPRMWKAARTADVIHAPVGGDVGTIGIFIALIQRKRLYVRHCGTWGKPASTVDAWLQKILEIIASPQCVVFATGGAETPPSRKNPNIKWIFSTSLSEGEITGLKRSAPWRAGETLKLVTVGRISAGKNISSIIRALPMICKKYPQISLSIVGDGEALLELKRLAEQLCLLDKVIFHGNVSHDQVLSILASSHLFVFPTFGEGFPKALLEALACGLPAVATNTSVIPYLIRDCGVVLSQPNADAVASAVLQIICDEKEMQSMSLRARQVAEQYTLEKWRDEIRKHLEAAWGPLK